MPDLQEVTFKINLLQGSPITFKVGTDEEKRRNAAYRLEKAMDSSYVGIKLPDKLILMPTHNIQSIEIMPPPPHKMVNVVNDATLIDE
ncbi:hypothetical protein [Desulfuromonas sp. TF]|uniref:hypothetical protein n=1 Tax=Desulfuromonas sp. TF TaxID=1232410 RepID=UPI000415B338|nr:hypothetical protein [Desulfuromonas sp. TF]